MRVRAPIVSLFYRTILKPAKLGVKTKRQLSIMDTKRDTKLIIYGRHARRRMNWRNISPGEIESVIRNPERVEPTERGRKNLFKRIGGRHIRVTVLESATHVQVITAVDKAD